MRQIERRWPDTATGMEMETETGTETETEAETETETHLGDWWGTEVLLIVIVFAAPLRYFVLCCISCSAFFLALLSFSFSFFRFVCSAAHADSWRVIV